MNRTYRLLSICLVFSALALSTSKQDTLKKLLHYKWQIIAYKVGGDLVEIPPEVQDMYWFTFHEKGKYTTMFEGEVGDAEWQLLPENQQLVLTFPRGQDTVTIDSLTNKHLCLSGNVYGENGYMLMEKWQNTEK